MTAFCDNRDILLLDPAAFLLDSGEAVTLGEGSNGAISSTTFTATGGGLDDPDPAGMVLCVHDSVWAEGEALEILSASSSTAMTVSRPRSNAADSPIAPAARTGLTYAIRSFGHRISMVSQQLSEILRYSTETAGIAQAEYADSAQLRRVTAVGVLAEVFAARASLPDSQDVYWHKARHHRQSFLALRSQLLLALDMDGDGTPEETRCLGQVRLRRM